MKRSAISPFFGTITALDPRQIPGTAAQDALNVRMDDGALRLRYGVKNLLAAIANFSAFNGAQYVQGYSGTTLTEEYIVFMKVSGVVKPYYITLDSATGAVSAPVVITDGANPLTLNDSEWVAIPYQDVAYAINPNETTSVYKHTIETATSWTAIAPPVGPALAPTVQRTYPSGTTGYTQRTFTSVLTGDVTYTGIGSATGFAVNADGSITLGTTNVTAGALSFIIDMKTHLSNQDWTYNDVFYFTVQGEPGAGALAASLDPASFVVTLTNDDGSPLAYVNTLITVKVIGLQAGTSRNIYGVRIEFDKTGLRANWDNIRIMTIAFTVTANSGIKWRISPWTLGGVWMRPPGSRLAGEDGVLFAYSYYNSTNGQESGLSPDVFVPNDVIKGLSGFPPAIDPIGSHLTVTMVVSGDSAVTDFRLYAFDVVTGDWRRVVTQADSGATYVYRQTYKELNLLTAYSNITPFKTDKCTNAFTFKGSMVWLYLGGVSNVRYSRIGDAERQASDLDQDDDLTRGETFTLSENLADEPLFGCQAGDTAFIAGSQGIYSQTGDYPPLMTPTKKLAGSFGAAGKFAGCRWKDDSGNPGIAWITKDGQIFFAPADPQYLGDDGSRPFHLSESIQTGVCSPVTFLRDGQSLTNFSTCRMGVDEVTDSLWVLMGSRALVFRKNANGDRYWEPYRWSQSFPYLAFSPRWRMRVCRSTGKFDELEWDTANAAYIKGALRDDGVAVPSPYWQSKLIRQAQARRVMRVYLIRSSYSDRPTVTIVSERSPSGNLYQMPSGMQSVRTGIQNQGRELSYKIVLPDSDCVISVMEAEETPVAGRL